jgi:hypothetical protein
MKRPVIALSSVPDTLAALRVDPKAGLTRAKVETRRKTNGYNYRMIVRRSELRQLLEGDEDAVK